MLQAYQQRTKVPAFAGMEVFFAIGALICT
jgi:hypothetical protein